MPKSSLVKEYFFYHDKYTKIYGKDNTVVMYCKGVFYELYATLDNGPNLHKLSEILNVILTKADKSIEKVDESNPYLLGVPLVSLDKYLKMLINNNYTVVVVDQLSPPPDVKRAVTGIYSLGTYVSDSLSSDSNNIVCIYISEEKQRMGGILTCVGLSCVDITTGETCVYEVYSSETDEKYALDEAYRFIITHNPTELIVINENKNVITKDKIITYLELEGKNYHYTTLINKSFYRLTYQNELLNKVYPDHGMMTPIEYIDMEKTPYSLISFVYLLDFAYKHNDNLINYLAKPVIFTDDKYLILGNNAVYQLNIVENKVDNSNNKCKSLFDIVNNTSTALGRRFLKKSLNQPLNNIELIQNRYDYIDEMINNDLYLSAEKHLNGVLDIERLGRKITLGNIHPFELANLLESFEQINNIVSLIRQNNIFSKIIPNENTITELDNFMKYSKKQFNINELKKQNLNDIKTSFFNKGVYPKIDELQITMESGISFMENICTVFAKYIDENKRKTNKLTTNPIQLKKTNRDGYYLYLTKVRADCLRKNIENKEIIYISDNLFIETSKIKFEDQPNKKNTKIFFTELEDKSDNVDHIKAKLVNLIEKEYKKELTNINQKYNKTFKLISQFISLVDFIKSGAKTAKLYNYCKPNIVLDENNNNKRLDYSYISCKKLRHPIIERIKTDTEYIPHDINLGKDLNGMLVYGHNGVGKSVLQKAIGTSVIMAQAGLYVPAEFYEYSPYSSIYARISGNDDIYRGLSSFGLEMSELSAIMKRSGPRTLVISDELTKGTEHISGIAIVATTVITLAETKSSFICATHIHELAQMQRIKQLSNVKVFHLTVNYDKEKDLLIFDRQLKEGPGESFYGLVVAKYILKNNKFMKLAQEIKNEILEQPNMLLVDKKSHFNTEVIMDHCEVCNKKNNPNNTKVGLLEVHHIINQKYCSKGFSIEKSYIPMNNKSNLVVLCKNCHYNVHHNKLKINGFKDTSKGRIIDYEIINKTNTKIK